MDQLPFGLKPLAIVSTLLYSFLGLLVFGLAIYIMDKVSPFSIRKEIEEDQNVALAIIMGSVLISLAMIIQAAIRG